MKKGKPAPPRLTFTLKPLPHYPPEQRAAVVAERGDLVVVNAELMWDVDSEPLLRNLEEEENSSALAGTSSVMTGA